MKLLIVNFHYFGLEEYKSGIYPVKPNDFLNQLKVISKDYSFISQAQLVSFINEKNYPEGNFCLITFDDGLKQQMEAFKLLQKWGIPAIFYVPTSPIIAKNVLEVHKLQQIRTHVDDNFLLELIKQVGNYEYNDLDKEKAIKQYRYDNDLAREVKFQFNFKVSEDVKHNIINTAFNNIFKDELKFSEMFYMNDEDIKELGKSGMLGSHGHNHVPLSKIDNPGNDIHKSIEYLEYTTNCPILSFSYPYGSTAAVNTETPKYLQGSNVVFGLTMWRGLNYFNESIDPFLLNRVDTSDAPGGKIPISF